MIIGLKSKSDNSTIVGKVGCNYIFRDPLGLNNSPAL